MSTAFWVKIGLALFAKWLAKQKDSDLQASPLVSGLLRAESVEDLGKLIVSKEVEKDVELIVTQVAEEPAGNMFSFLFKWLSIGKGY